MGTVEIGTLRRTAGYDKKRLTGYNPARRYLVYFDAALHRIVHLLGYKSPLPGTGFFWQVNSCRIMSKPSVLHGGSLLRVRWSNPLLEAIYEINLKIALLQLNTSQYLSRIEGSPPKRNVAGSIPVWDASKQR